MRLLSFLGGRRPVDGRAGERVTEAHPRAELRKPRHHRGPGGRGADPEPRRRAPQEHGVAGRLGRREEQQAPAAGRQRPDPAPEHLLSAAWHRHRARQAEPAGQLRDGQLPRQFDQGQRVAVRLGDDLVPYPLVDLDGQHQVKQGARVRLAEAPYRQLRQPSELIAQRAGPEDQPCRLSPEAPGHERDHLRGSAIEPLLVIDHAQQRLLSRRLREQAQHGEADQEPVGNRPGIQPERDAQRVGLWHRDSRQPVKQWRAHLMQRRERQLHL